MEQTVPPAIGRVGCAVEAAHHAVNGPPCQSEKSAILVPMANDRRVALVTGGAKRVGRAIVERLAADGFAVAFTYHSSEREARELAAEIDGLAIDVDLTHPAAAVEHIRNSLTTFSDHVN